MAGCLVACVVALGGASPARADGAKAAGGEGPQVPTSGAIDALDATPSDEVPCGAEAELHVTVGPETLDPAQSQRVVEQVFSELAPQRAAQCAETDKGKRITHVDVLWPDFARAHVAVQAEDGARRLRRERAVDLTQIPPDGHPLAIAIAADELLRDLREQLAERPPAPPPPARVIRIESTELPLPLPPRPAVTRSASRSRCKRSPAGSR